MSESGDYSPGPWSGHDFGSAYDRYDTHVGRGYTDAVAAKVPAKAVLEPSITAQCENPLVILCDVTGSMDDWPKVMFSKLPYLEHEAKDYRGADLEIAFGAIGDAYSDRYPLQMRPFSQGTDLKDRMLELVIEKNGGGQIHETYELAALYCAHNVHMPNAIKPVLIMIGDEMPYDHISPDMAKSVAGVELKRQISAKAAFEQLKQRFAVYLIRKPYDSASSGDGMSADDREIRARWVDLLGAEHVCDLPAPERVVDVIFGILAKEAGRFDDFKKEIEQRQRPDQVATVYKSLATIHHGAGESRDGKGSGQSVMLLPEKGGVSKPLL